MRYLVVCASAVMVALLVFMSPQVRGDVPAKSMLCSPLVPGGWRSIVTVPASWSVGDCQRFGQSVGATHVQFGCIFSLPPYGAPGREKFVWGARTLGTGSPIPRANEGLYLPEVCGAWGLP